MNSPEEYVDAEGVTRILIPTLDEIRIRIAHCRKELSALRKLFDMASAAEKAREASKARPKSFLELLAEPK